MTGFLDSIRGLFPDHHHASVNGRMPGAGFWSQFAGTGLGYAEAALTRECAEVVVTPPGRRNHALNAAAFSIGQLVAGGALARDRAAEALLEAARRAGLGQLEAERTIASGFRAGAQSPRTVPDRPGTVGLLVPMTVGPALTVVAESVEIPTEADLVREHLPALDWQALWDDDGVEEWIVEPLLPARRLVALYSPPKLGKSLLMLELAVAVAMGTTVLGVSIDRPRRVLYIDFENDPTGDIRQRLLAMGYGPADLADLVYLSFPALAMLDSPAGGEQLMAAVRTYACEVVVVDTISRAIAGEENENDTWLNFYRHTGKALKAAGVSLIRLDHTGKDETRGQRGGSAKSGDVDMVWRMSKVTETMFRLDCEAHRMPVLEKLLVIHRETAPRLRHRVDAEGRSAAWRAKVAAVREALDGLDLPADTSRDKAREALRQIGIQVRNEVLSEVIRQRKTLTNFDPDSVPKIMGRGGWDDPSPRSRDGLGQEMLDEE